MAKRPAAVSTDTSLRAQIYHQSAIRSIEEPGIVSRAYPEPEMGILYAKIERPTLPV
jgi:hypothetical protein